MTEIEQHLKFSEKGINESYHHHLKFYVVMIIIGYIEALLKRLGVSDAE